MSTTRGFSVLAVAFLAHLLHPSIAGAGKPPAFSGAVIHIQTVRVSAMEADVKAASAEGYRVFTAWGPTNVLMTKAAAPEPVEYAVVGGFTAEELEAALTRAGAQGYRVVPKSSYVTFNEQKNGEPMMRVWVERTPGSDAVYESRVEVATSEWAAPQASGLGALLGGPSEPFDASGSAPFEPVAAAVEALGSNGFDIVAIESRAVEPPKSRFGRSRRPFIQVTFIGQRRAGASGAAPLAERYRVLFGRASQALAQALLGAAEDGYAPALWASDATPYATLLLERRSGPTGASVLAGDWDTNPLLLQVTRAAAVGCRVVSGYVLRVPISVPMRCDNPAPTAWQYRVFEDEETPVLADAVSAGWTPVAVSANAAIVLMERAGSQPVAVGVGAGAAALSRTKTAERPVTFVRLATAEKEVVRAGEDGFMLRPSFLNGPSLVIDLVRIPADAPRRALLMLSDRSDDKLEVALNEAAKRGFRVVPGAQFSVVSATRESVVFMEKLEGASSSSVRYRVIGAAKRSTFDTELAAARVDGDDIVATLGSASSHVVGGRLVVLEQPLK